MDLQKIDTLHFGYEMEKTERKLHSEWHGRLEKLGVGLFIGGTILTFFLLPFKLGVPISLIPFLFGIVATFIIAGPVPVNRHLPDSARRFLKRRGQEARRLEEECRAFSLALLRQQELMAVLTDRTSEEDEAVAEFWLKRRTQLQARIETFLREYEEETAADIARLEEKWSKPRRKRAFKENAGRLKLLEAHLEDPAYAHFAKTVDLSAHVAAAQLRERLEEERDELGLPERSLPPLKKKTRRLIPAKTG